LERASEDISFQMAAKPIQILSNRASRCGVRQVRLTPQDFGRPRKRDFAKLNLHLGIFDQPKKSDFFSTLLDAVPH